MKKTIVHIITFAHSGSTLLGNILGAHSKVFHIGELTIPVERGHLICRECLKDRCPIWGTILDKQDLLIEYFDFKKRIRPTMLNKLILNIKKNYAGNVYKRVFDGLSEIDFIIDGSKNLSWIEYQLSNIDFQHKIILLNRNLKATIASHKRRHNIELEDKIFSMKRTLKNREKFLKKYSFLDLLEVSYEDIALNFKDEISRICDFLNISFQNEMVGFNDYPHHLIGGNIAGFVQKDIDKGLQVDKLEPFKRRKEDNKISYYSSFKGLKLDERWKVELTQEEQRLIDESFGY